MTNKTCGNCESFMPISKTCGNPMTAHVDAYLGHTPHKVEASEKSCGFYYPEKSDG